MSFMFHHPSPPPPPPPVEPEKVEDEGKAKAKRKIRAGASRRQTILTSPLGIQEQAPIQTRTLLGG